MNQTAIFWPMIAHAALVVGVYVLLGLRRRQAVRAGSGRIGDFRENRQEPPESLFVKNNLANQFELPVLFHAVCLGLYAVKGADLVALALAWIFAVSRFAHAVVHVTSNRVLLRSRLFLVGLLATAALWIWLAIRLAAA